jgi:hypothetical protein
VFYGVGRLALSEQGVFCSPFGDRYNRSPFDLSGFEKPANLNQEKLEQENYGDDQSTRTQAA